MQSLVTTSDYIVCLALETTASQSNIRRLFVDGDKLSQLSGGAKQESAPIIGDLAGWAAQNGANQPRIVHMDWCVCAVKDFKVIESKHAYVNPGVELDAASAAQTRLTADLIKSQGVPFPEALNQMVKQIQSAVGSGKYRICTFGDWPVRYQLALEAQRCGIPLPEAISGHHVNVLELHYDQNPSGPHASSIEELLKANELEPIVGEHKAKTDGASLVRILNRMVRGFQTRLGGQGIAHESTEESKPEAKRDRSRSRSRDNNESTDAAANSGPKSIGDVTFEREDRVGVRMRGLPWRVEVEEIEQFFSKYSWVRDSIKIGELEGGRRTGFASVLFETEDEAQKAVDEMDREHIGSRWIMLYTMEYHQWESFMDDQLNCKTVDLKKILNEDNVNRCVQLRGMPREVTLQDIKDFFGDFDVNDDDVHIEMRMGRKTGFALVMLNGEDDVQRARDELNRQYIGSRYIDVLIPRLEEESYE